MRKLGYLEAFLIVVILGVLLWMLFPSAAEIRRLRGDEAPKSGHKDESVLDRGFILAQLKANSSDAPDLAFAYLRRHQDEEMETLVSEYFGRLGDLDRQLLWLLRADEKESDPKRKELIMRLYLQMGRVAEARQFLSKSIEANQDMASLQRLADLGDSRPLMTNMNSRRETLSLEERIRLVRLFFEVQDFSSAIASLSPRLEGLWVHARIVETCLEILDKDPSQFQGIYPVLAHAYLYRADARILQAIQNNMDRVLPSDSIQWDTELALMYGDFVFISQLLQKIADTGNKDNLLQVAERMNLELSREPLSEGQKTVFPEVFTSETAPLLDWPLHLSPRFVRAGCEVKESFCFQSNRSLVIQKSDFEEYSKKLLESVDPEKKILRILSQDTSSVLTEELYLVWNRAGVTSKSIPYLLELWERSGSTRLWSEILDGSLNLGDYATVWFLLRSQKNRELVSEWVFANESFQTEPAFSGWMILAIKDDAQDWLMPLASVYGSKRQWDQASKMWELVATRDPQHKNSRELLAHWNRYHSKLENASRYAVEAVGLGSTDPLLLLMVANDSGAKGNSSEASQYYTSACELFRPKAVDELVLAFEACHKAKNYQKSALLVERLVLAEPENQYWVSVWHQELKSNQDWDSLLKIGSAMDLEDFE
jgi:tetratricopeptide (TPR) repeat protein